MKTALITGASSGIGMEFARAFAKKGYRLILTARRRDRLEALKKELKVPCRILVADLSDQTECSRLMEIVKAVQIDVFINNAGFGDCGRFYETSLDKEVSMIRVNIEAMHHLFKKMLVKMREQGYGHILNVASSAGLLPAGPYMATYYATKSYVVSLTKAVAQELLEEGSPLYVGALCPGPVDTEFNDVADVAFALKGISAKRCVREALCGMRRNKVIIVPTLVMKLGVIGQRIAPDAILLQMVSRQQRKKFDSKSLSDRTESTNRSQ